MYIRPQARKLKLKDPRIVKRYTNTLDKYFKDHSLYKMLLLLSYNHGDVLTDEEEFAYEEIDRIQVLVNEKSGEEMLKIEDRKLWLFSSLCWSYKYDHALDIGYMEVKRKNFCTWTIVKQRKKVGYMEITNVNIDIAREKLNEDILSK